MNGVLFASRTIFVQFELFGGVFSVFHIVVVTIFAFSASKCNFESVAFFVSHFYFLQKKLRKNLHPRQEVLDYDNIADDDCQENSGVLYFIFCVFIGFLNIVFLLFHLSTQ